MRRIAFLAVLAAAFAGAGAEEAEARNFRISGGIQYVAQGDKEKAKGLHADARRIYGKAVTQLLQGVQEDPGDHEAWDYLGRAYAELDSSERTGWAFASGIRLACAKEEEKKLCKRLQDNRKFYWSTQYQAGFETFRRAESAGSPEAQRDSILAAAALMRKAIAIWSEEPSSYCNLAAFYAKAGDYPTAMEVTQQGLAVVPSDSCLTQRKNDLTIALGEKAAESGEFDVAIAAYEKALAADPNDVVTANRLGELYFQKGTKLVESKDEAGAKAAYAKAAQGFQTFQAKNPDDESALYNYALALEKSGDHKAAAGVLRQGLAKFPASLDLHTLIANAYTGLSLNDEATKHRLVALIVREGTKAEDPKAVAEASAKQWGAASDAAKLLGKLGPPEEVRNQKRGEHDVELWAWWSKGKATTMVKGRTVSDLEFLQAPAAAANTPKS